MSCCNNNCNHDPCGSSFNQSLTRAAQYAQYAQTQANKAEDLWLEFNALYLGAFAVAPTQDNQGNPLQVGALYWNTGANELYAWNGLAWVTATGFNEFTPFLSTGSTTPRNLATRMADVVNVKDFGASSSNTKAQNKTALQNAISYLASNNGGTIFVPMDLNYGYDTYDKSTWPLFSGTKSIIVFDYSIGDTYGTYPITYDGTQLREFFYTPQTTTPGMHDGNVHWIRADWHPCFMISTDADYSSVRSPSDNRRASLFTAVAGRATWRVGQGSNSGSTLTNEEMSNFIIEKFATPDDTIGNYNVLIVERATGNCGFGVSTNAPGANYLFKAISAGYYQGVFESLGNTSYVMLRTSAGTSQDAGIRNVAGNVSFFVEGQGDALIVTNSNRRVTISNSFVQNKIDQTYGTTVAIDAAAANWFTIGVTNSTAFTISAPVNPADGQQITITIVNQSGGAMGAITWNPIFKLSAWTNPANGFNRSITFGYSSGGNLNGWYEVSRTTSDISN